MKEPVLHSLDLTKLSLREFGGRPLARSFNFNRTLADFSFMPVFTKYILHKPSDIACHVKSPD
jgi:hypothetical protein